jgi:hypothetical protein
MESSQDNASRIIAELVSWQEPTVDAIKEDPEFKTYSRSCIV